MRKNEPASIEPGVLYICGTPIGNLEDITLRVLRILKEVDMIAAEDTRHTRKLLSYFDISKPLISCYQHNEVARIDQMLKILQEGKNIALVSDAGMPGISDPGSRIIEYMRSHAVTVEVIPGVTALTTAVVNSGFSADSFVFMGFWPRIRKEERLMMESLLKESKTSIIYESPHRLLSTVRYIAGNMPERNICICRELTKKFEEVAIGTAQNIMESWLGREIKGECVLIIQGCSSKEIKEEAIDDDDLLHQVYLLLNEGWDRKSAISEIAKKFSVQKRRVYALVCKEKEEE